MRFFSVIPAVVDEDGNIPERAAQSRQVITHPWPGLACTRAWRGIENLLMQIWRGERPSHNPNAPPHKT